MKTKSISSDLKPVRDKDAFVRAMLRDFSFSSPSPVAVPSSLSSVFGVAAFSDIAFGSSRVSATATGFRSSIGNSSLSHSLECLYNGGGERWGGDEVIAFCQFGNELKT